MARLDRSRGCMLGRTCLFIECTDRAILLVNHDTPLVHETGLLGIVARQVDSGESRLRGLRGSGSGDGGHWSEKERNCLKGAQPRFEASSIYAGPLEMADTASFSLFSHGSPSIRKNMICGLCGLTVTIRNTACISSVDGVNRNFGHSSSSTRKKRMTSITSAPSTYVSLMIIPPYAPACLMLNTPLVASTASHSASQLLSYCRPRFMSSPRQW